MPKASECLETREIQRLLAGELEPAEREKKLEHLEGCDDCARRLASMSGKDTLIDLVRQAQTLGDDPAQAKLTRLMDRLRTLVPPPGTLPPEERTLPPHDAPAQIIVSCPGCQKSLKVKATLAGKKVKCPKCGQVVSVSETRNQKLEGRNEAAPELRTLPPRDEPERPTVGTGASASGRAQTRSETSSADEDEPWDFLAPPQQADEIGRLGPYRILKVLGHGGMGVVFRAEDPRLERIVAIKAMLPALAASPSAKKRFLREAKTAASIKHDHIVTIYQVDEDRGAPYLAMEFLHGEPLDARLKRGAVPLDEALRIGEQIAEGLAAAHDTGLIHRDIKPANIWLETRNEPRPSGSDGGSKSLPDGRGSSCRVKILDFGLARSASDQAGLTASGAIVGTPSYMAPEQAQGGSVDHRCDLFSLGCVLYVMLTGQLPFKGNDTLTVLMAIASNNPPPPDEINPEVPQDLSDLTMQLLAKKPEDRPTSAREVAEALRSMRGADTAELTAKPTGKWKGKRPAGKKKRRPLVLAAVAVGVLALVAAGVVFFFQTPNGSLRVEINDPQIEVTLKGTSIVLKQADKEAITLEPGEKVLLVKRGDFNFETKQLILKKGQTAVVKVELLPGKIQAVFDGKVIGEQATVSGAGLDRAVAQWALKFGARVEIETKGETRQLNPGDSLPAGPLSIIGLSLLWPPLKDEDLRRLCDLPHLKDLAFDGTPVNDDQLAIIAGRNTLESLVLRTNGVTNAGLVHLKKMPRLTTLQLSSPHITEAGLESLSALKQLRQLYLPNSEWGPGLKQLIHLPLGFIGISGKLHDSALNYLAQIKSLEGLNLQESSLTDSQLLRLAGAKKLAWVKVAGTKVTADGVRKLKAALPNVSIEADAAIMKEAAAGTTSSPASPLTLDPAKIPAAERYDWQPKELVAVLGEHGMRVWRPVRSLSFSPDGKLATGSDDGFVRFWNTETLRQERLLLTTRDTMGLSMGLSFARDAKILARAAERDGIQVWDLSIEPKLRSLSHQSHCVALSADGKLLASGSVDKLVRLWHLGSDPPKELAILNGHKEHVVSVALSADGKTLASASADQTVRLWAIQEGKASERGVFTGHKGLVSVALSADGKMLVSGEISAIGTDALIRFWDLSQPKAQGIAALPGQGEALAFSPDGKTLAACGHLRNEIVLFDLAKPKPKQRSAIASGGHRTLAFSPDGKTLAAGLFYVELWDMTGKEPRLRTDRSGHLNHIRSLAFAADGKTLVSVSNDALAVWDLGHPVAKKVAQPLTNGWLPSGPHGIYQAVLAARASKLASTGGYEQSNCFLWDLTDPARATPVKLKGQQGAASVAISADGTILATDGDATKEVRIWDLTGEDIALLDTNEPKRLATIKLPKGHETRSLTMSADGKTLAVTSAGQERQTQLWDLSGAEPRLRAQLENTGVFSFSPDGKKLVCLGPNYTPQIWEASGEKLRLLGKLEGYIDRVTGAAVSPDGRTIAVTGSDGQVRLWDGKTRRWDDRSKKDDLPGWQLPGSVHSVAFHPDGKHLVTGNGNGTVYILRLPDAAKTAGK